MRFWGVADGVKFWGSSERLDPEAYMPGFRNSPNLVVRAQGDPSALASLIRSRVRELDVNLPLSTIRPMNDIVAPICRFAQVLSHTACQLLNLGWIGTSNGTTAVVLASAGIYGVISYTVKQSTCEIGLKIALGADALGAEPRAVLLSVLRQGMVKSDLFYHH